MSVMSIVKQSAVVVPSDFEHRQRISELTGNHSYVQSVVDPELIRVCKELGLVWWVGDRFVSSFLYAATVCRFGVEWPVENRYGGLVTYIGDIPEFALDRIETVKQLGFKYVTIHSNQPLPVTVMHVCDPVLVAWKSNPGIQLPSGLGRKLLKDRPLCRHNGYGLVIAAWGEDLEELA